LFHPLGLKERPSLAVGYHPDGIGVGNEVYLRFYFHKPISRGAIDKLANYSKCRLICPNATNGSTNESFTLELNLNIQSYTTKPSRQEPWKGLAIIYAII
jgi:hypothetical protein